jgi:hypothetical protein
MSNSTSEYWSVDGVSLQTHAFNVVSLATKFSSPKMRGSDRQYAYQHGKAHRRRWADEGSVTLGMWVIGQLESGEVPESRRAEFRRNMRKLIHLFTSIDGTEFDLTKRWYDEDTGALMAATGKGLVPTGLEPGMEGGPYRAKFVVDVLMADPFFYGAEITVAVPLNTDVVIDVPGDAATNAVTVEFLGALSNPLLTNQTPVPDVTVKIGSSIASDDAVFIDVAQTTVLRDNDGANLIGTLTHSGARPWFELKAGLNTVRLSADSGAGSAVLKYRPVWY